ncbi:Xyloglucan endotransglucosylase/hydrolase protein 3 [Linum perenne]
MKMKLVLSVLLMMIILLGRCVNISGNGQTRFGDNFIVTWGFDHFKLLNNATEVQLTMDESSGGAGFESKQSYGSGCFHVKMQLTSDDPGQDELDFEMIGGPEGNPIGLQTNMFINGVGGREQVVNLWFDPTADFHDYTILWNQHQIVFSVDEVPIRVIKNSDGVDYPTTKAMIVVASLWNGEWWGKANWSNAPFVAHFKDFSVAGCPAIEGSDLSPCFSSPEIYWWNAEKYWALDSEQEAAYENVTLQHLGFNYCNVKTPLPPECAP